MTVPTGASDGHPARATRRTAARASSLELLLDLVFVLTVSQVARAVAVDPGAVTVGRAVLVMAAVWWMYDAYVWLTNQAVPDTTPVRVLLVAAMAAFLVVALAIPDLVHGGSTVLGWAYVAAALIHGGLFIALGGPTSARVMTRVMPLNVAVGLALVLAGHLHEPAPALLAAPLVLCVVAAAIAVRSPFDLAGEHFAERHGLLMIIALGESVVSLGAAVGGHGLEAATVGAAVLVVGVVAALWWCYFSGDDARAAHALEAVEPRRRTAVALRGFYLDHLVMLVGLTLLGSGLHHALEEPLHRPEPAVAWLVGGGVALFLIGEADYRRALHLGPALGRGLAAAGCLALAAARPHVLVMLGAVVVVVVITTSTDARAGARAA